MKIQHKIESSVGTTTTVNIHCPLRAYGSCSITGRVCPYGQVVKIVPHDCPLREEPVIQTIRIKR